MQSPPRYKINLKTAIGPRKTRNQSILWCRFCLHPLSSDFPFFIPLKIFVLFVFFVDQSLFLGLSNPGKGKVSIAKELGVPYSTFKVWFRGLPIAELEGVGKNQLVKSVKELEVETRRYIY